jgi:hypothetical protein
MACGAREPGEAALLEGEFGMVVIAANTLWRAIYPRELRWPAK